MAYKFWQIFRIPRIKNFEDTDWLEGQIDNGGQSFRGPASSLRGLPAQSPTGTGFVHVTGGVTDPAARAVDLSTVDVTGILGCAHLPAFTGDVEKNAASCVQTLAIVNADVGTFIFAKVTVDAKGRILAISSGVTVNAQVGTTYALQASDNGKLVTLDNAAAITLTIPAGISGADGSRFACEVIQLGAGLVSVVADGGVVVNSFNGWLNSAGQHAAMTVVAYEDDVFNFAGNTAA